ncbi:MAG: rhamnogalacturonan acetylesterase [Acidobacteria bacterium]|nr:rhamnogalacturonan acetylesterase [Acidobacteriota bacterium]
MFFKLSIIIALLAAGVSAQTLKFDFGTGRVATGYTKITAADVYTNDKGYGFEDAAGVECLDRGKKDALRSDLCRSDRPFYFSAKVPEGNYLVTVVYGDAADTADTAVKAELRRLMLEPAATAKGKFGTARFVVNVRRPEISTGGVVKLKDREKTLEAWAWDDRLTLEFNGKRPAVDAVTIERADSVPTVFLLGDSTVCDQPREPYASWGQMLTVFFGPGIAVANHAESGESVKSSTGAKRLDKVLSLLKPGDFVIVQYSHNDEKEKGDGVGAMTTFKASLIKWIEAIRAKGGNPILVTPMHRRTFDADGRITNSHGEYPDAVRAAAKEKNVPLVDLTAISKLFYEALGKDGSGAAFKEGDGTHHNNYGAYELALLIADSLRAQKLPLARYLKKTTPPIDPKKPLPPSEFKVPASPLATDVKPLGN